MIETIIIIIIFTPFMACFEALQDYFAGIVARLFRGVNFTNYQTITMLGGRSTSHEPTIRSDGLQYPTTETEIRPVMDPSGNHLTDIEVVVPTNLKLGIAAVQFYLAHAFLGILFPPYIFFFIAARIIIVLVVLPFVREKWDYITFKIKYYQSANFIIDQLNRLPLASPIKKTYSSLTTYPIIVLGPFALVIFWAFKKFYLKSSSNTPHAGKDSRGQAALNLGLMVLAFVGYSDFGLWKKFQDWIRFSEYATKAFGDSAAEETCINYNPKKFNIRCVGTSKGKHACITCAADMITKEPQVLSVITRKFDQRSIMEDPAPYYYELVAHLFLHDKSVPDWFLKLRPELQLQIFKAHYADVYFQTQKMIPKEQQLNPQKVISKEYTFFHNMRLNKWTIIPEILDFSSDSELSDEDMYDEEKVMTIQAQYQRQQQQNYEKAEAKINQPHTLTEEKEPAVPFQEINVTTECSFCRVPVTYPLGGSSYCAVCDELYNVNKDVRKNTVVPLHHAEVFELREKDEDFDITKNFPFLNTLPKKIFKPLIFVTAMCLILYGSYYFYRKRRNDQTNQELQAEVIKQAAAKIVEESQKFQEIPPILQDLEMPDEPEGKKGGVSRHRDPARTRHERKDKAPREQQDDSSDTRAQPKSQFQMIKQFKQKNFITYDIDKLENILQNQGIAFVDPDDKVHYATTKEQFEKFNAKGYQVISFETARAGMLDLTNLPDVLNETEKVSYLSDIASHKPIARSNYRFVVDAIEDKAILPDRQFLSHLYTPQGEPHYVYDHRQNLYIWFPDPKKVQESALPKVTKIIKQEKTVDEIVPLRPPMVISEEQYERNKQLLKDLDLVQANEVLAKQNAQTLNSAIVAEPESNIATIESDDCVYGLQCKTKRCPKKHPEQNEPEAMNGHVPLTHYPDDLHTDFAYPIFLDDELKHKEGSCYLTPLGFKSLRHVFKDRDLSRFTVLIKDKFHTVDTLERFPQQHGFDGRVLAEDFQDSVVFKIKDHVNVVKGLTTARTALPRDGSTVMVITTLSNGNVITNQSLIRKDPDTGMYLINTNNDYGDSGSAVVDVLKKNVIGTYWGTKAKVNNYVLPMEIPFVAAINGNQKIQISKNIRPSL